MNKRHKHSFSFKFKVALEVLRERETLAQLGSRYEVASAQISQWKKHLMDQDPKVFSKSTKEQISKYMPSEADIYRKIRELEMQLEWLKKSD